MEFHWSGDKEDKVKVVLDGLEPHSNLRSLYIYNFRGRKFASWFMMENRSVRILENLTRIKLDRCSGCKEILTLGHLPHLKFIEINGLENWKRIGPEFYGTHNNASSSSGTREAAAAGMIFPSLR